MSAIINFDSNKLNNIIKKFGLRNAWLSIIATHLNNREDMQYIVQSDEFHNAKILDDDIIKNLTIGEISVLYEYSVAIVDTKSRKSNGQFFTPDDVACFMAGFSKKFPKGIWLDPCSGIGNLSWHLVAKQNNPEEFLQTKIILSDKDELALLIARAMLVSFFQDKNTNLYNDIKNNFIVFDFLSVADNGNMSLENTEDLSNIPKHDFVIVNPPYLSTKQDKRFETAHASDLYAYFLENIIKTSKGFISITPQSFTNASKFKTLRKLILKHYSNLTIFAFDNVPGNIFKGIKFGSKNTNTANSTRAAITIALQGENKYKITSLMRWKNSERIKLFQDIQLFLTDVNLTEDYFPKINKITNDIYYRLYNVPKLSSIMVNRKTDYALIIPSSPRYFISALKNSVERSSIKTIYFNNEKDRNIAYMLINSSIMYWWWRVRDGGMTLSLETIKSLPMPKFDIDKKLIDLLEQSEKYNKVYKLNAKVVQENVKHPRKTIIRLNSHILPEFSDRLIVLHDNTEFSQSKFF